MTEKKDNPRREEILDGASALFAQKGYENTSTNDILAAVGIARGTLYYYFSSKEDILDGILCRMVSRLMERVCAIVSDRRLSVTDRLPRAILCVKEAPGAETRLLSQLHKPQNALMQVKLQQQLLTALGPQLTTLVQEGVAVGAFHTERPAEAVEMCLLYANTVFSAGFPQTDDQRTQRSAGFIYNLERLLGVVEGTLVLPLIRAFAAGENQCPLP